VPNWLRTVGLVTLALCVSGVFAGIFYGGFPAIWRAGHSGNWSWWQYALTVPALGLVALSIGALASTIIAFVHERPRLRRAIYLTFMIGLMTAFVLVIGWTVFGRTNAV
jgi:hypothetical protein